MEDKTDFLQTCGKEKGVTQHPRLRLELAPALFSPASQPPEKVGGFCQCHISAPAYLQALFFLAIFILAQSILGGTEIENGPLYLTRALLL